MTTLLSRDKQRAMKTSIEHIRAKITELEARITDLRITERELEALGAVRPAGEIKAKAKRKQRHTTRRRHDRPLAPPSLRS